MRVNAQNVFQRRYVIFIQDQIIVKNLADTFY